MSDMATGRSRRWRKWRRRVGSRGGSRAVRDDCGRWGYSGNKWTVGRNACASTRDASCVDRTIGGGVLV